MSNEHLSPEEMAQLRDKATWPEVKMAGHRFLRILDHIAELQRDLLDAKNQVLKLETAQVCCGDFKACEHACRPLVNSLREQLSQAEQFKADAERFAWWFETWKDNGDPITDWLVYCSHSRKNSRIDEWREYIDRQVLLTSQQRKEQSK